jgi:hypothetical protein
MFFQFRNSKSPFCDHYHAKKFICCSVFHDLQLSYIKFCMIKILFMENLNLLERADLGQI